MLTRQSPGPPSCTGITRHAEVPKSFQDSRKARIRAPPWGGAFWRRVLSDSDEGAECEYRAVPSRGPVHHHSDNTSRRVSCLSAARGFRDGLRSRRANMSDKGSGACQGRRGRKPLVKDDAVRKPFLYTLPSKGDHCKECSVNAPEAIVQKPRKIGSSPLLECRGCLTMYGRGIPRTGGLYS